MQLVWSVAIQHHSPASVGIWYEIKGRGSTYACQGSHAGPRKIEPAETKPTKPHDMVLSVAL